MNLSELKPAAGSKYQQRIPSRTWTMVQEMVKPQVGLHKKDRKPVPGAPRPGFEGGQLPLYRRLPKRGFTNINSKDIVAIGPGAPECI